MHRERHNKSDALNEPDETALDTKCNKWATRSWLTCVRQNIYWRGEEVGVLLSSRRGHKVGTCTPLREYIERSSQPVSFFWSNVAHATISGGRPVKKSSTRTSISTSSRVPTLSPVGNGLYPGFLSELPFEPVVLLATRASADDKRFPSGYFGDFSFFPDLHHEI